MRTCDWMIMLMDHEMSPVGMLIASIQIRPVGDLETGYRR